jgi:hypothetical protein
MAVTVAASDDELLDHAGSIFRTWTDRLAELGVDGGLDPAVARRLAATAIAATEGAVVMGRAEKTAQPLDEVATSRALLANAGTARKSLARRRT